MDKLPVLNVSSVFDYNFMLSIKRTNDVLAIITILLSILMMYLIIKVTPTSMKSFKPYLLFYVISGLINHLINVFYIPVIILPYSIIFPIGWLSPMPYIISKLFNFLSTVCNYIVLISLLMLLIKKYFVITVINQTEKLIFYKKISFYLILSIIVSLIPTILTAYLMFISNRYNSAQETANLIKSKINNSDGILKWQPELLSNRFDISEVDLSIQKIGPYVSLGCVIFFFILYLIFIILNTVHIKNSAHWMTTKSKRNHIMLLRMLTIQVFGLSFFTFAPQIFFYFMYLINDRSKAYCIVWTIKNVFFLYDATVTITFIKPYRMFIVGLFVRLVKIGQVDVVRTTTISNVNSNNTVKQNNS